MDSLPLRHLGNQQNWASRKCNVRKAGCSPPCSAALKKGRTDAELEGLFKAASSKSLNCLCSESKQKGELQLVPSALCLKVAQSCLTLWDTWTKTAHGILQAGILEWIAFPFSRGSSQPRAQTQVSHCRRLLYRLSHRGSPRILEWVAYSFSSGLSQPRNRTRVSCIVGGFFTNWAIRESQCHLKLQIYCDPLTSTSHSFYGVIRVNYSSIKLEICRTRWQRSRWTWSTSLSMDSPGIHLQTQKCMQKTSWEQTRVPDQWKRIYRPMQNSVGQRN